MTCRLLRPLREVAIMAGVNLEGESGQLGLKEDFYEGEKRLIDEERTLKEIQMTGRKESRIKKKKRGSTSSELKR